MTAIFAQLEALVADADDFRARARQLDARLRRLEHIRGVLDLRERLRASAVAVASLRAVL